MESEAASPPAPARAWPLFLIGFLLFVAGIAINVTQIATGHLSTPWYLPIMATLGVVCMGISVVQRVGVLRCIGLGLFMIVCGLLWFFVVWFSKTPVYDGPAKAGSKLPLFAAAFHDGTPFTQDTLEDGKQTAMIFFRGRW